MNVLSLFDGISCGYLALQRAGIPIGTYYASEIDKTCIKVSQKHFPNIIQGYYILFYTIYVVKHTHVI